MHLRDLKISLGATVKLSVRAVDGAGNVGPAATAKRHGLGPRPGAIAPAQDSSGRHHTARGQSTSDLPRMGAASPERRHPRRAGQGQSRHRRADPRPAGGYLAANHLWDAAGRQITLQAARNEFVAFQILAARPNAPAGVDPARAGRSTGRPARRSRSSSAAITPSQSRIGPLPDPIVPLIRVHDGSRTGAEEPEPARRDLRPARPGRRASTAAR